MANDYNDDKNKQHSGKQDPTSSVNTTDQAKNSPSQGNEQKSGQNPQDNLNRTPSPASDSRNRKDPGGSEQSEQEDKRRAS